MKVLAKKFFLENLLVFKKFGLLKVNKMFDSWNYVRNLKELWKNFYFKTRNLTFNFTIFFVFSWHQQEPEKFQFVLLAKYETGIEKLDTTGMKNTVLPRYTTLPSPIH